MNNVMKGRAFVFGSNLDTDQIYPGRYLELTDEEDIRRHAMEGADPDFVDKFQTGDFIVGGRNFGCGSSREHAAAALKAVGAGAILAESFARIFYRNAINLGFPVLICPGISDHAADGDVLTLNLATGEVVNETRQVTLKAEPPSDYMMKILAGGGIVPLIRQEMSGE